MIRQPLKRSKVRIVYIACQTFVTQVMFVFGTEKDMGGFVD